MRIRWVEDTEAGIPCLPDGVLPPEAGPPEYLLDDRWHWIVSFGGASQGRVTHKGKCHA